MIGDAISVYKNSGIFSIVWAAFFSGLARLHHSLSTHVIPDGEHLGQLATFGPSACVPTENQHGSLPASPTAAKARHILSTSSTSSPELLP